MKKLEGELKQQFDELLDRYPSVRSIAHSIAHIAGSSFVVGGAVRDLLLGLPIKDIDIEVHGLSVEQLEKLLNAFGPVSLVGKAFGVLRVHGLDIDWSLPRADTAGRKPTVIVDPMMSLEQAFRRRDLTINAMGINILTYELIDPFGGLHDLRKSILRAPDAKLFIEDPLRFYRVMQFVARFEMQPDAELNEICSRMDISGVSRERIEGECAKWLLKSKRPSLSLDWLDSIHRLAEIFPQIAATKNVQQNPDWHPEGDVFEHTKQTVDAAASFSYTGDEEKLPIMYAALCHDLGKVTTTEVKDGRIVSYEHEKESEILTRQLLKRFMTHQFLITQVTKLVRYHMHPTQFVHSDAGPSAYKRLATKLAPEVTLHMLGMLAMADKLGRNPKKGKPLTGKVAQIDEFLKRAQEAKVAMQVEQPILHGRDLLDVVPPGPKLGKLVKEAYRIQIEEGITNKEVLKQRVLSNQDRNN
jgi:tRNA nucleotidyltransferase (CCA-adding enzyme)